MLNVLLLQSKCGMHLQVYMDVWCDTRRLELSTYFRKYNFTKHLDTGFSWLSFVYKRMLRWFPSFQVATACFSCSPPDLNSLVTFFSIFVYMYNNHCHRLRNQLQLINIIIIIIIIIIT